ncbi:MAG: hypothetical protein JJE18_02735 [Eubacteriaceae bacterium]|nr:hypothetical protein [Eubacteriaceae bacterium]
MKKKDGKIDKPIPVQSKENTPAQDRDEAGNNAFPGYPHYPASDDIYNTEKEVELNPEDLSKTKGQEDRPGKRNEKDFCEDMTGEDLDVPGSKADETEGNSGSEDEENNYYSLGGDDHNDLEEDEGE